MNLGDRQRAMLREMGIRLWSAGADAADGDVAVDEASQPPVHGRGDERAEARSDARADPRAPAEDWPLQGGENPAPPPRSPRAPPMHSVSALMESVAPPTAERRPAVAEAAGTGTVSTSRLSRLSFDELAASASTCTACRLCEGRRHVVFGSGPVEAQWMIVGDAPGDLEDQSGLPFGGKPGQLLDNMLRACGLDRTASETQPEKQVFLTNALKCRPLGANNPTADELASCEPYLLQQIALVKPKVVIAMGRYAIQSLLHSNEPLGKLRGRVHRAHGAPDVSVIVTYSPVYLLRNGEDKARAWDDLCLAMETVRG